MVRNVVRSAPWHLPASLARRLLGVLPSAPRYLPSSHTPALLLEKEDATEARRLARPDGAPLLSACATIFSGTTQNIAVSSTPPGATVKVEPGGQSSTTPAKLSLRRKDAPYRLTIAMEGYEAYTVTISAGTNGWIWGNLILGGLVGIIIDSSTGAANALSPDEVHGNLVKAGVEPQSMIDHPVLYVFNERAGLVGALVLE